MIRRSLLIGCALVGVGSASFAQTADTPDTVLPGRPDAAADAMELDAPFISTSAGISVRPPVGGKMIRRSGAGDEVVRFVNDDLKWQLVVSRFLLTDPMPLMTQTSGLAPGETPKVGFVDSVLSQLADGESIRTEPVPISGFDGALLATRARDAGGEKLIQHAIVRRSDKVYFVVTFTVPISGDKIENDPAAIRASNTFATIQDSIELLDQESIANDQTERLLRTRSLMVNWTQSKLDSVLVSEQYLRLLKDGKDIGYTYIVEEPANDLPRDGKTLVNSNQALGIRIGVRSRTMPSPDLVINAESWMWMSYGRDQEAFSTSVTSSEKGREPRTIREEGSANRQDRRVPVKVQDPQAAGTAVVGMKDDKYELKVISTIKDQSLPPIERQLPPFYLPSVAGQLLPRLLPLNTPTGYLWASYVSDTRNVMLRYVDVMPATSVTIGGATHTAVPVQERMGVEGSITTHYIAMDGTYRGSVNQDNNITIIPATEAEIQAIWKDATLSRPADVDGR